MAPMAKSLSPELLWRITKPVADALDSKDVPGASTLNCPRDVAVNFFRNFYHAVCPIASPLPPGSTISDYSRVITQSLPHTIGLPPRVGSFGHRQAFDDQHGFRSRSASSEDDAEGDLPTLDSNPSDASDEDSESIEPSPGHSHEPGRDSFRAHSTEVDFDNSSGDLIAWEKFPSSTGVLSDAVEWAELPSATTVLPGAVEWAELPSATGVLPGAVEWAPFPSTTAAPHATLELSAGNDFEEELREYTRVVSQATCNATSPLRMAPTRDGRRDDAVTPTIDVDRGGDPMTWSTPLFLGALRPENDLPTGRTESVSHTITTRAGEEPRIDDREVSPEADTTDPASSENDVQARWARVEREPSTSVDSRVLVGDGRADGPSVAGESVRSDPDFPSGGVSADFATRDVAMMDYDGRVTALRAAFAQKFPPSSEFHAYGTTWTRDTVLQLLSDLEPGQTVTELAVNYVVHRLRRRHYDGHLYFGDARFGDLHDGFRDPLEELPLRLLVPLQDAAGRWSLVEASPMRREICHYAVGTGTHTGCESCGRIQEILDRPSLLAKDHSTPEGLPWQHRWHSVPVDDDPGWMVIWMLHVREYGGAVDGGPPAEMRFLLAQELVEELSRSAMCREEIGPTVRPSAGTHHYWLELDRRGYPGVNEARWALVQRMGYAVADRLYQLAFNIATPRVFVDVQRQLARCRGRQRDDPTLPGASKVRLYQVLKQLETHDQFTQTRLRLGYWQVGHLFQRKRDAGHANPLQALVEDFRRELDPRYDGDDLASQIQSWYRSSWPWVGLAHAAGGPLVLCFLPCGVNQIPGGDKIYPTTYRKLKKDHLAELARILERFRPNLLSHLDPGLVDLFLYSAIPPFDYELESWDEDRILGEPLDSDTLKNALGSSVSYDAA